MIFSGRFQCLIVGSERNKETKYELFVFSSNIMLNLEGFVFLAIVSPLVSFCVAQSTTTIDRKKPTNQTELWLPYVVGLLEKTFLPKKASGSKKSQLFTIYDDYARIHMDAAKCVTNRYIYIKVYFCKHKHKRKGWMWESFLPLFFEYFASLNIVGVFYQTHSQNKHSS